MSGGQQRQAGDGKMTRLARAVVTGQIVICAALVLWMVLASFYFNREAIAVRSLDYMAKDYYENYFYEKFLGGREANAEVFEKHIENGFPKVNLRQLLTFDGARNGARAADFYDCDKKMTMIKITPVEPFGRGDYALETKLACGWE